MSEKTIITGVIIHEEGKANKNGRVYKRGAIRLPATATVPLNFEHENIGEAKLKFSGFNIAATLKMNEENKNILGRFNMYATVEGRVLERGTDNEILAFNLDSVSIVPEPPYEGAKTIEYFDDMHKGKIVIAEMIASKQKLGWTDRRIKRWLFDKHQVVLE